MTQPAVDAGQTAYTHEVARVSELIARAVTAIKRNASGRPYIGVTACREALSAISLEVEGLEEALAVCARLSAALADIDELVADQTERLAHYEQLASAHATDSSQQDATTHVPEPHAPAVRTPSAGGVREHTTLTVAASDAEEDAGAGPGGPLAAASPLVSGSPLLSPTPLAAVAAASAVPAAVDRRASAGSSRGSTPEFVLPDLSRLGISAASLALIRGGQDACGSGAEGGVGTATASAGPGTPDFCFPQQPRSPVRDVTCPATLGQESPGTPAIADPRGAAQPPLTPTTAHMLSRVVAASAAKPPPLSAVKPRLATAVKGRNPDAATAGSPGPATARPPSALLQGFDEVSGHVTPARPPLRGITNVGPAATEVSHAQYATLPAFLASQVALPELNAALRRFASAGSKMSAEDLAEGGSPSRGKAIAAALMRLDYIVAGGIGGVRTYSLRG